ncbi:MAG TPA: EAL domain-containing protein [Pseudolabrys sp.]|nr:EAL domain-containing protein [Pseudolabrys sp.]
MSLSRHGSNVRWFPRLVSARNAQEENAAALRVFNPVRIIIACAVALGLIVLISASLIVFNLRNRALSENEQALLNSALLVAKQLEQTFTAVETVQRALSNDLAAAPALDSASLDHEYQRHELHLKLRDKAGGMPYVGSLAIFNARGQLINSSRQWPIREINVATADYFKALRHKAAPAFFLGGPVRDDATGSWIIHLAHRISGPNDEFLGIVSAAIELGYLQNYFRDISPTPNRSYALFRTDGMLLARYPDTDSDLGHYFPNALSLKLVSASNHGVGVIEGVIDGFVRMVAAHRVGEYPIVVSATRTTAEILAHWQKTVFFVAGGAALLVAIIAAFALLFTRLFKNHQALEQARAQRKRAEQLREQSLRFDVALNNMSQGLVMFDAQSKLLVSNTRFMQIYGLSKEVVQPGISLLELLKHRKECGSFGGEPEEYCSKILQKIAKRQLTKQNVPTPDGRIIQIVNQPMPDGGWVATHEDISEKIRAESALKRKEEQLNAALENISQGVCMFDRSQRLIICNAKYADIYGLTEEQTKPGTPLQEILAHRISNGAAPDDHEVYVRNRLNEVSINQPYEAVNCLRDGRYVSVAHRPMNNGGWVATHQDVTEAIYREESFRLLFEGNPVPMWVIDRSTLQFLAVNEAAVAHYGYSREQFMAMSVVDLRPAHDRERFKTFIRGLSDDQFVENIGQHIKADGTKIDVAVYSRAMTYEGRGARLTVIHDITKTKQTETELRRTKIFLDAVIEHVPLPIIVRDVEKSDSGARGSRFALFNRAYEELTGDSRSRLIGKTAHELFPPERADMIVRSDNDALQGNKVVSTPEHYINTANNGLRLVKASKIAIRDDSGEPQYLLTVLDDITERRRSEQHISYLAHNDSLTGLPNRTSFLENLAATLEKASRSRKSFAVMCLDLDRFKEANDVYGHLVGDGLLREAARRLQIAAKGAFLARIGGDEFIIVVSSERPAAVAAALGDRMVTAFKENFEIDGHQIQVGLSVGVAVYPNDGKDAKTLIANADAALYQAKSEVRGTVRFFEEKLGSRLRERRELQTDLRSAPSRGDLFLHYQPQKTIALRQVIGFEALARWKCPKRGWVSPETFISIAEQSTHIISLGEWILREACKEAASWPTPLKLAVNISPIQFHHGDLPTLVHSILLETGLAADRLELEITEGVLIDDFSRAVSILRKLKLLGVHIALDDFGSGYSSLSYLHAFPFEKIKIDRVFVGDLENNHHSMAIVRAIITLGHSLNIPVLAEGVETESQLAFLAQEGCDEVQGYLTGRPLPIEAYAEAIGVGHTRSRRKAIAV